MSEDIRNEEFNPVELTDEQAEKAAAGRIISVKCSCGRVVTVDPNKINTWTCPGCGRWVFGTSSTPGMLKGD